MQVDFSLLNQDPNNTPIGSLAGGFGRGLGFGQDMQMMKMRQQQMAQQQAALQQAMAMREQQMQQEQEAAEQAAFSKSLEYLTDPKYKKLLSGQAKQQMFEQRIKPGFQKYHGVDLSEVEWDGKDDDGPFDRILGLAKAGADPSILKFEFATLKANASKDELPTIKAMEESLIPEAQTPTAAPAGYRFKADGSLEAIPGGPADIKATEAGAKDTASKEAAVRQADRVISRVDRALTQIGPLSTGAGSLLSVVPGTGAKDLKSTLTTIKANLGFAELQAMRAASPTGGALGQVAVQELEALQSTVDSLDQGQSEEQIKTALTNIKKHYENWKAAAQGGGGGGPKETAEQRKARLLRELMESK